MSKKKNTLKDLDEFLKQQAATLVSPAKLSEQIDTLSSKKKEPKKEPAPPAAAPADNVTAEKILNDLKALAEQDGPAFRKKLYDLLIHTLEQQRQSLPEDKMLINTALYLKSGDQWKEAIRAYWKQKR